MKDGAKLPPGKKQASQVVLDNSISSKSGGNSFQHLPLAQILAWNVFGPYSVQDVGSSAFKVLGHSYLDATIPGYYWFSYLVKFLIGSMHFSSF